MGGSSLLGFGGGLSEWVHIESSGRCPHRTSTYVLAVTGRFLLSRVRRRVRASQPGVREAVLRSIPKSLKPCWGWASSRWATPKAVPPLLLEEGFQEEGF